MMGDSPMCGAKTWAASSDTRRRNIMPEMRCLTVSAGSPSSLGPCAISRTLTATRGLIWQIRVPTG
eukprot:8063503-Alexandrium_andersonii.AAC.1